MAVVLGDSGTTGPGGESPYLLDSVDLQFDDLDIYNEVVVTPAGQSPQIASDAASQTTYGKNTLSVATFHASTSEAHDRATFDLNLHKTPLERIRGVSFTPLSDPQVLFPAALGFELLTMVEVRRRPKDGAGSTFDQLSSIEGIEHAVNARDGSWKTTWRLSPTDAPLVWIIEDPVAGKIVDGASQSPPVVIGY